MLGQPAFWDAGCSASSFCSKVPHLPCWFSVWQCRYKRIVHPLGQLQPREKSKNSNMFSVGKYSKCNYLSGCFCSHHVFSNSLCAPDCAVPHVDSLPTEFWMICSASISAFVSRSATPTLETKYHTQLTHNRVMSVNPVNSEQHMYCIHVVMKEQHCSGERLHWRLCHNRPLHWGCNSLTFSGDYYWQCG